MQFCWETFPPPQQVPPGPSSVRSRATPSSSSPRVCFLSLILPFLEILYMWTHTERGLLCLASSVSMTFLRFVHVGTCVRRSCLFTGEQDPTVWLDHRGVSTPGDGHLRCSTSGITHNAALIALVQALVWACRFQLVFKGAP